MRMIPKLLFLIVAASLFCGCAPRATNPDASAPPAAALRTGDEGMWTLTNLPLADLKQRYDFTPTEQWLRHIQLSAVRVGGASGAFVSPDGLVLTNHHVASGQLHKLSSAQKNYLKDGFYAHSRKEELKCPDIELNVLISMEDVTQRVLNALDANATDDQRNRQRKAEIARIEKESMDGTGLRSDVVSLYQGGEYWLYRYKRYTDVRLVMAPEFQAAFFGGDPDNFTYPRYDIDFAFFRVYENDQPAKVEHYLKWSKSGPRDGELVFVAGHPGSTERLRTVAQLQYERDQRLPMTLKILKERQKDLYEYAKRGPEQARQVQNRLFGVENSLKARTGMFEGLNDPKIFQRLASAEKALRNQVRQRPELKRSTGDSWDRIAEAVQKSARRNKQYAYSYLGGSQLLDIARGIVNYTTEIEKPNDQRYEEYRDSSLPSTELRLFSPAPIYPELEEFLLTRALEDAVRELGANDPIVSAALGGRDLASVARELISGTKLADPAQRRALVKAGRSAVDQSTDPLIVFARKLDPIWRELRKWYEDNVQSVESLEGGKIARARFEIYGHNAYPDATGTLRLAFGRVAGYPLGTTFVPYKTTFYDLFGRSASFDGKPPFDLAPGVAQKRGQIDLSTPLNFVSTNDIIGGNSGSPVINRDGEYVGLIFDGNIQSLVWAYAYSDEAGRAVSVHSAAIIESLRKIYPMPELLKELIGE